MNDTKYGQYKDSGFRPLESRLLPLVDNGLTPPGKRSGEGLASILPYLVKALRGKPREPAPPQAKPAPRRLSGPL